MTKVFKQSDKSKNVSGAKAMHYSQFRMLCPGDTRMKACGVVRSLALMTHVTTDVEKDCSIGVVLQRSSYVSAFAHKIKVFKQSDKSKYVSGAKAMHYSQRSSFVSALAHMTKVFKQSDKSKNVSGAKAMHYSQVLQSSSYVSAFPHMTKVFKQSDKSRNISGAKSMHYSHVICVPVGNFLDRSLFMALFDPRS
ncbi:hypothetical protein KIW84_074958 [Lathyrus oleraceus]|uniref:Uncharacterized protein n=1 Tax=Pisum sativum TaxID=3888 RepID=A0A9D4VU50_PEA|nr:hypothetical protein KIW84_074958 [Pisum sativum]